MSGILTFVKLLQQFVIKPLPKNNMKLIVGLGNPGKKYEWTRHNLGWLALDAFADNFGEEIKWQEHHKAKALVAKIGTGDNQILLAKPLTFMNDSGKAVRALVDFYKIDPANLIIVHDEVDIAFKKMKIVKEARAGGHKGVDDIFRNLGTAKITRLRLGIKSAKNTKPPTERFVLQPFSFFEKRSIKKWLEQIAQAIECLVNKDVQNCMNRFN